MAKNRVNPGGATGMVTADGEAGLDEALLGLSLSHQQPVGGMMGVACRNRR